VTKKNRHIARALGADVLMKLRMDKTLGFWVDVAREHIKSNQLNRSNRQLTTHVLREYERVGYALRALDDHGRMCWKATPAFLERLADAEGQAKDDLEDVP
jgi:hypothetical protein